MEQDERFMMRAIGLAARGAGQVTPNPMVGAVLVLNGRIIGEGWHDRYGDLHAEAHCLASVAEEDRPYIPESTMYVTLEPCAHQGRQPSCAWRLVQEGIRKVVMAVEDPFPEVAGKGISILRDHGIEVVTGVCEEEARWMCRRFLHVQDQRRPYIILKWAQSADGFIAPSDCARFQLSNHYSQTLVHKWRTEEAAIMVGFKTAMGDNPQLTARLWSGRQPVRIALDRYLHLPLGHHLRDGSTATWILNLHDQSEDGLTRHIRSEFDHTLLPELFRYLLEAGCNSLVVEGGARLFTTFISAGFWDEARVFETPKRLHAGVLAPPLYNRRHVWSSGVQDDLLKIYLPANSPYTFHPSIA